jgi:hypothetical protein
MITTPASSVVLLQLIVPKTVILFLMKTVLQGGEPQQSLCTDICGPGFSGKSCGKAVLFLVYPLDAPENSCVVCALLDDQRNRNLARSQLFDMMCVPKQQSVQYILSTCAGRSTVIGRQICRIVV